MVKVCTHFSTKGMTSFKGIEALSKEKGEHTPRNRRAQQGTTRSRIPAQGTIDSKGVIATTKFGKERI
jgi:hypothetical protein